jgi:hypothetical protein
MGKVKSGGIFSKRLVAATMIMSNKIISKD